MLAWALAGLGLVVLVMRRRSIAVGVVTAQSLVLVAVAALAAFAADGTNEWLAVAALATRTVGPLVRRNPAELVPVMRAWATGDDLWLRRTAIIHQVGAKAAIDRALLSACIEPSLSRKEFFLRKAIGWALRDLAWHDPDWVVAYVRSHAGELSGLSRREALKNVVTGE